MTCKHCDTNGGVRIVALITDGTSVIAPVAVNCSHMSDKDWFKPKPKPKKKPTLTLV